MYWFKCILTTELKPIQYFYSYTHILGLWCSIRWITSLLPWIECLKCMWMWNRMGANHVTNTCVVGSTWKTQEFSIGQTMRFISNFDLYAKFHLRLLNIKGIFRDPQIRSTLFSTDTDFIAYSERTLLYKPHFNRTSAGIEQFWQNR